METKIVPVTKLKPRLLSVIDRAQKMGQEYIVTKNGKPAAVIMSFDEWESWKESMSILSNQDTMSCIRKSLNYFKEGGKGLKADQVFRDDQ